MEIKTLHKHERSSRRALRSFSKASNTIEKIDDEIDAVSSASSRYRDAVKAIDDACFEKAAEEKLELTSEGIDKVRNEMKKAKLRPKDF